MVIFLSSSRHGRKKTEGQTTKRNATNSKEPEERMRNAAFGPAWVDGAAPARWGLLKQLLTKPHFLARLTVACPSGASVCGEGWVRRCRAGCLLTCVDPAGRSTPLLLPASLAPRLLSPPLLRVPPPLGKPTSVIKPFQHLLGAGGFAI